MVIRLFLAVVMKNLGRREEVQRVNTVMSQHLVISWARLIGQWSKDQDIKGTSFFKKFQSEFFGLFSLEF